MWKHFHMLSSTRQHPVVLSRRPNHADLSVLTVELYEKWYGLIVVHPSGAMQEIPFPTSETMTPYVDHVPNPQVVKAYADANNLYIDELALELIVGRWNLR